MLKNRVLKLLVAKSYYSSIIKSAPDCSYAYLGRGISNLYVGSTSLAAQDLTKAIELNQSLTDAYQYRGRALSQLKQFDAAITDLNESLARCPDKASYQTGMGIYFTSRGKYDDAFACFDRALTMSPRDPEAFVARGDAYSAIGDRSKAIHDYDDALNSGVDRTVVLSHRLKCYTRAGQCRDALVDISEIIVRTGKNESLLLARGAMYFECDDFDSAIDDCTDVLDMNPRNLNAHFLRGLSRIARENYIEAATDFTAIIELDPSRGDAYIHRAYCRQLTGSKNEAKADESEGKKLGADMRMCKAIHQEFERNRMRRLLKEAPPDASFPPPQKPE